VSAELAAVARAQRGPAKRAAALAMIVFGIGAGLRPGELAVLRGSDVTGRGGRAVARISGGPAPRTVPVAPLYAGRAVELASRAAGDFLFRPGTADRGYKNFVNGFAGRLAADPDGPRLSMGRCRSSFICGHLAAGTPVPLLLAITGIAEAGSLARYARHVPDISSSKGGLRARWRAESSP
jgi:integrase